MKQFGLVCLVVAFLVLIVFHGQEPKLCTRCGDEYKTAYRCPCCGADLCESCAADAEYFMGEEYNSGYNQGLEDGYEEGYSFGYDDGYSFGFSEGAEAGYEDGYSDAEKEYLPAAKE